MKQKLLGTILSVLMLVLSVGSVYAYAPPAGVASDITVEGLIYQVTSEPNKEVELIGRDTQSQLPEDLVVPETITHDSQTYKVVAINSNMNFATSGIKTLTISEGIVRVGEKSFAQCTALTSLTLPSSLKEIGDEAFKGCTALMRITTSADAYNMSLGQNIFQGVDKQSCMLVITTEMWGYEDIQEWNNFENKIGSDVNFVKDGVRYRVLSVVTKEVMLEVYLTPQSGDLVLPETVEYAGISFSVIETGWEFLVDRGAGGEPTEPTVTSITVPASYQRLGPPTMRPILSLTAINVAEDNPFFTSLDGVIFTKDKSQLLMYPAGKPEANYTIPAEVQSFGQMAFQGCTHLKELSFDPNTTMTSLIRTFRNCTALETVHLPQSVTLLEGTFQGCSKLNSIVLPNAVENVSYSTFDGCTSLSSIVLPNSVTEIGNNAFARSGLTSITIPESVGTIGSGAFAGCKSLATIELAGSNQHFAVEDNILYSKDKKTLIQCPGSKAGTFVVPNFVETIGERAFAGCQLEELTIPENVSSIKGSAFAETEALKKLIVQRASAIHILDYNSLWGLDMNLCTLVVPTGKVPTYRSAEYWKSFLKVTDGETSVIEFFADNFKYLVLKNTATEKTVSVIGLESSFYSDYTLEVPQTVEYDNATYTVTEVGIEAFQENNSWSHYLTGVTLPATITRIDKRAFYKCEKLKSITLPAGLKEVGREAFESSGLTSITIPASVTEIGSDAFNYMPLTSIVLEDGLQEIDLSNFATSELTSLNIPKSISSITFEGVGRLKKLSSINVDPQNTHYASEDGILFNASKTTLVRYPSQKNYTEYVIPSSVTKIEEEAFENNNNLKKVTIPNSVKTIGAHAFTYLNELTTVVSEIEDLSSVNVKSYSLTSLSFYQMTLYVPNGKINDYKAQSPWSKFDKIADQEVSTNKIILNNLQYEIAPYEKELTLIGYTGPLSSTVSLPATIEHNGEDYTLVAIKKRALSQVGGLEHLTIPSTVTSIGSSVLEYSEDLKTVDIQANVAEISGEQFLYCSGLHTINLSENVTSITKFEELPNLSEVTVDADNPSLSSVDGVVFSKDASALICYPRGKTDTEYVIPESVQTIKSKAFYGATKVNTLTIPRSVETIESNAFNYCIGLSLITSRLNTAEVSIGSDLFEGVDKSQCVLKVRSYAMPYYEAHDEWKDFQIETIYPTGVKSLASSSYKVVVLAHQIKLSSVGNQPVSLYSLSGQLLYSYPNVQDELTLSVPQAGIYLLKVGHQVTKVAVK